MLCPRCSVALMKVRKEGVHVDVCKMCKGVWLDAGELERIIGRSYDYRDQHLYGNEFKYHHSYKKHPHKEHVVLKIIKELFD